MTGLFELMVPEEFESITFIAGKNGSWQTQQQEQLGAPVWNHKHRTKKEY